MSLKLFIALWVFGTTFWYISLMNHITLNKEGKLFRLRKELMAKFSSKSSISKLKTYFNLLL